MKGDDVTDEGIVEKASRTKRRERQERTTTHRRSGGLAVLLLAVAMALAACSRTGSPTSGASSPTVASLPTAGTGNSRSDGHGSSTTTLPKGSNPTALVDEWATCERGHGDPGQVDPTIDSHGVINISILASAAIAGHMQGGSGPPQAGPCSQYLAKAQVELRADDPVSDPQGPSQSEYLQYVNCMRANGVPNFPYPVGDKTNFNGTGVNPNSPAVIRVNDLCGKKLGLPAWWINGWGPPGDISVTSGPNGGPPPSGATPSTDG